MHSFSALLERYRAVLFDAYGVLKTEAGLLPGAVDVLARLRAGGPPAWVVTNDSSRPPEDIAAFYADARGLLVPAERFVTSGLLASDYMQRTLRGRAVAWLGPPRSVLYLERAGVRPVRFEALGAAGADDDLAAVALMDDSGFAWVPTLEHLVNLLRARPEVELLAPNPDLIYPASAGRVGIGAGSVAGLVARAAGRPARAFGKPDPLIFTRALELAREVVPDLAAEEVLMVGDTLETDIAGAAQLGLATCLLLSGNTAEAQLEELLARAPVRPTHVARSLQD